jgi:hypothetical protein
MGDISKLGWLIRLTNRDMWADSLYFLHMMLSSICRTLASFQHTVHSLIKLNATVTSQLPAGTAVKKKNSSWFYCFYGEMLGSYQGNTVALGGEPMQFQPGSDSCVQLCQWTHCIWWPSSYTRANINFSQQTLPKITSVLLMAYFHRHNLRQGLLLKSKLAQHAF